MTLLRVYMPVIVLLVWASATAGLGESVLLEVAGLVATAWALHVHIAASRDRRHRGRHP
jgi:hypothetical protein